MTRPDLLRALRRALILSLSVPPIAACGGNVVVDGSAAGGGSTGTTTTGTTVTTAGCTLVSTMPIGTVNGGCQETFAVAGTPDTCGVSAGGPLDPATCQALCPANPQMMIAQGCTVDVPISGSPGGASLNCGYGLCGTGRRPPGLADARQDGPGCDPGPVARFLGEVAHLEAAAVVAFERLGAELEAHGAPPALVGRARRSAREEVRHARVTRRFAERAGARPAPVVVEGWADRREAQSFLSGGLGGSPPIVDEIPEPRSLEALAVDNAVEGCVRETFGAVLARRQAQAARDPALRHAMEGIARDETRHAAFSWELAGWLDERLDADARVRVRGARDRAVDELLAAIGEEPDPSLVVELGLPTAAQARAAAEDLRASIWA